MSVAPVALARQACRAACTGATDRRHASSGQHANPRWRPVSRQCMWRDTVLWSRHPHWRDQREHGVQIFFNQDYY
jgi:hypothetical protein